MVLSSSADATKMRAAAAIRDLIALKEDELAKLRETLKIAEVA